MSVYRPLLVFAATAALAACATVPQPLQGTYDTVAPSGARQGAAPSGKVRWGGEIIRTEPGPQQTCFYLLSRPLDKQARPKLAEDGQNQGRFVACRDGFYDPEVFTRGRELTVTGTLAGTMTGKIGDFDYAYPKIDADVVYLWPKRPVVVRYPSGFYDPFWGPGFGPYWGPWGDPFWYRPPPVIIVRPAPAPAPKASHK